MKRNVLLFSPFVFFFLLLFMTPPLFADDDRLTCPSGEVGYYGPTRRMCCPKNKVPNAYYEKCVYPYEDPRNGAKARCTMINKNDMSASDIPARYKKCANLSIYSCSPWYRDRSGGPNGHQGFYRPGYYFTCKDLDISQCKWSGSISMLQKNDAKTQRKCGKTGLKCIGEAVCNGKRKTLICNSQGDRGCVFNKLTGCMSPSDQPQPLPKRPIVKRKRAPKKKTKQPFAWIAKKDRKHINKGMLRNLLRQMRKCLNGSNKQAPLYRALATVFADKRCTANALYVDLDSKKQGIDRRGCFLTFTKIRASLGKKFALKWHTKALNSRGDRSKLDFEFKVPQKRSRPMSASEWLYGTRGFDGMYKTFSHPVMCNLKKAEKGTTQALI